MLDDPGKRLLLSLAVVAALGGCLAGAPAPASGPAQGPSAATPPAHVLAPVGVVRGEVSDGAEPMIVADPNGKYLWIGDTSGVYFSKDHGAHFLPMGGYNGDFSAAFGDGVGLALDGNGHLYGAFLHDNRADVARSDDGESFSLVSYVAGVPVDRPWIAAYHDTVAMIYLNNLGAVGLDEACARSTDGGQTFLDRSPTAGPSTSGGIVMLPDGSFYFTDGSGNINRHTQTCSGSPDQAPMITNLGVNNFIPIATNGVGFFVAAAGSHNVMQVAGIPKWGARPVIFAVSPADLQTNTYAAVSAVGDDVAVAWYGSDKGGDPSADGFTGDFNVYAALIHDYFGPSPTVRLWKATATPNHKGTICMGGFTCTGSRGLLDYFGVALGPDGKIHIAYVDDAHGTAGTKYVQLDPATATEVPLGKTAPTIAPGPASGTPQPSQGGTGTSTPGTKVVARFTGAVAGFTLAVDAANSSGDAPLEYTWDWGDGGAGSGVNANHTYADRGNFSVTLTVHDASGHSASANSMIAVGGSATVRAKSGHSPGLGIAIVVSVVAGLAFVRRRDV